MTITHVARNPLLRLILFGIGAVVTVAVVAGAVFFLRTGTGSVQSPPVPVVVSTAVPAPDPTAAWTAQFLAANPTGRLTGPEAIAAEMPFSGVAYDFDLEGQRVRVYVFDTEADRAEVSARIAPDGGSYRLPDADGVGQTMQFGWTDYPHFWAWTQYLIEYIGHDGATIDQLTNAFGSHFAGGAIFWTTLEAVTAQTWTLTAWGPTPDQMTGALPQTTWLRFVDGQISGSTGINDFGVPFTLTEDENDPANNFKVAADSFVMSERTDPDELKTLQERAFVAALKSAHYVAVSPDSMTISSEGGMIMAFSIAADHISTPVISPPLDTPMSDYFDTLTRLLRESEASGLAAGMQSFMAADFGYGLWRSEWRSGMPATFSAEIAALFGASDHFTTELLAAGPFSLLDGQNPYDMLGPDIEVSGVLLLRGLGVSGRVDALLWIVTVETRPVWRAMLVAPDGFSGSLASQAAPAGLLFGQYGDGGLFRVEADGTISPLTTGPALVAPTGDRAVRIDFSAVADSLAVVDLVSGDVRSIRLESRLVGCYLWQDAAHVLCGVRFADEEDGPNLGHLTRINVDSGDTFTFGSFLFSEPAVSNDGLTVAFDGGEQPAQLWRGETLAVFNYLLYDGTPYTTAGARIGSPAFAHNNRHMTWLVGNGGTVDVVVFDLEAQTAWSAYRFEPAGFGGWFPPAVWSYRTTNG